MEADGRKPVRLVGSRKTVSRLGGGGAAVRSAEAASARLPVIASAMRRGYATVGVRLLVAFADGRRVVY